jgi:uncharacterized protein YecE (DUF72 family)
VRAQAPGWELAARGEVLREPIVRVLTGTSGFSYTAWKGSFYPSDLPTRRMLSHYATRLGTVEVNATFYRMPRPETLAGWRTEVPSEFVFALKAPQRITHVKRLGDVEAAVSAFYRASAELGATLGPVLYQLPPSFKKDLPRLEEFLAILPAGGRTAFEFRHASWFCDEVFSALARQGAALCLAEDEDVTPAPVATAEFGYLRLRRPGYVQADLRAWAERILAQRWREALVYFKHEDEARGPAFALALRELVGEAGPARTQVPAPQRMPSQW